MALFSSAPQHSSFLTKEDHLLLPVTVPVWHLYFFPPNHASCVLNVQLLPQVSASLLAQGKLRPQCLWRGSALLPPSPSNVFPSCTVVGSQLAVWVVIYLENSMNWWQKYSSFPLHGLEKCRELSGDHLAPPPSQSSTNFKLVRLFTVWPLVLKQRNLHKNGVMGQ